MFKKILIANRGEIAVRIMRTCREMGIGTVAVYSEPDSSALHVLEADESVCLGSGEPASSYLSIDKIMSAAREKGAGAIHPGYGFLAENPEFVRRCESERIVFIGPPSGSMLKLGDKVRARETMKKEGIPVIPGFSRLNAGYGDMEKAAEEIGYPVLIKAAAGGGGRGMRIVLSREKLKDSAASASSEAMSAFGDGRIFIEKYIERPRHVEFQVLADSHGNAVHLMERECSIQRRFQKIIEESPSPALSPSLREEMGMAAVKAVVASGYVNAGTVEFILDREGRFYFLEVNTRLQVEHPVTEMVTGIDIVRKQLEIAAGGKLSLSQGDISARGHAMECRIYAEDPELNFAPSPGRISFLKEPHGPGVRVDSGVYGGFTVPFEYDPLLSKLITHGETREINIMRMLQALRNYIAMGIKTTIPFMIDIIGSVPYMKGEIHTGFIDEHFMNWRPDMKGAELAVMAYLADDIFPVKKPAPVSAGQSSPWNTLGGWRIY